MNKADLRKLLAQAFADSLATDAHGCFYEGPTGDMRVVIRGDVSLIALADAAMEAIGREGMVIVPRAPTLEMERAVRVMNRAYNGERKPLTIGFEYWAAGLVYDAMIRTTQEDKTDAE